MESDGLESDSIIVKLCDESWDGVLGIAAEFAEGHDFKTGANYGTAQDSVSSQFGDEDDEDDDDNNDGQ